MRRETRARARKGKTVDRGREYLAGSNDDIIDGDEYELDEEADKSHNHKADRRSKGDLREL